MSAPPVVLDPRVLREQAYLIARGVRPVALVGHCSSAPLAMMRVATQIEVHAEPGCIPFVVDREDGCADFGYAAAAWAVDLLRWMALAKIPSEQEARIMGLLLGYSPNAIRTFEERRAGRAFPVGLDVNHARAQVAALAKEE